MDAGVKEGLQVTRPAMEPIQCDTRFWEDIETSRMCGGCPSDTTSQSPTGGQCECAVQPKQCLWWQRGPR